ncbi:MAG: hypothetical protein JO163_04790, partial [Methylobacteriaceae bacterium]|nr:hypothetical protein [Methylobacteriaceae bacterium]
MYLNANFGRSLKAAVSASVLAIAILPPSSILSGFLSSAMAQETGQPASSAGPDATPPGAPQAPAPGISDEMRAVLAQYGQFVQTPRYGEVWTPSAVPQGWHPYMACDWVNSRQYGWYYDDKTPWGAIVHHYGRWAHDDGLGWIWIPGQDFSPGWVVWRTSPEWTGWAPIPPDQDIQAMSSDQFN